MGLLEIFAAQVLTALVLVSLLWLLSVPLRDASIIDMAWGPIFVAMAWVLMARSPELGGSAYLAALLVTLWGLRLGVHLTTRNLGRGEDRRYALWREHGGEDWWWRTYYRIFLLQGGIALLVATPLAAAFWRPQPIEAWHLTAALVWATGFFWEWLADIQLQRFKADPANAGRIMDQGLWGRSRHPNYFGDALQWWGLGLLALTPATWWALIGPAVMTAVFLGISNDVLEKGMTKRHPAYGDYVTNTPRFFPKLLS